MCFSQSGTLDDAAGYCKMLARMGEGAAFASHGTIQHVGAAGVLYLRRLRCGRSADRAVDRRASFRRCRRAAHDAHLRYLVAGDDPAASAIGQLTADVRTFYTIKVP